MSEVKDVSGADATEAIKMVASIAERGYWHFADEGVMPSLVLSEFARTLPVYEQSSYKNVAAAAGYYAVHFLEHQSNWNRKQQFLTEAFVIAGEANEQGIGRHVLRRTIGDQVPQLFLLTISAQNTLADDAPAAAVCKQAWENVAEYYQTVLGHEA